MSTLALQFDSLAAPVGNPATGIFKFFFLPGTRRLFDIRAGILNISVMWVIYLLPFWQISRWWAFPFPHLRARALINNWIIRTDSPGKKKKKSRVDRKRESDLLHRPSFSISGESSPSSTWSPTTTETGGTQSKKVTDLSTKIASMHRSKQYFFSPL